MKRYLVFLIFACSVLFAQTDYGAPGTLKWKYKIGGAIFNPAIGEDGIIYVAAPNVGYLHAVNSDGTLRWKLQVRATSSPSIGSDGTVYLGAWDNCDYIYAINNDGSLKWRYKLSGIHGDADYIAIGSHGTVYVGDKNCLYAIDPSGSLQWRYQTGSRVWTPAIGADGTVYFWSYPYFYALNPDGSLEWRAEDGGVHYSIDSDGNVYGGSSDDFVYAYNLDGTLKWRYQTESDAHHPSTIGPGSVLYIHCSDDYIYAINLNGTLKWRYRIRNGSVSSGPVIGSDGTLYVGVYGSAWNGDTSSLCALNPNGTLKWRYKTGDDWVWSEIAMGSDGTIYVGSRDGYLYAIRSDSRGLADSPWPKFQHDNQNTGNAGGLKAIASEPANPPSLSFSATSSTGTNTLVGGTVGGVVVVVRNTGKGNAQLVKVSLSGDDELCKLLGWSKDVAFIESGDSAVVEFTRFLPTDLERRTVNLKVSVTEGRGYSPADVKSLTLNLVPASRTQTEVELVEDVDHDIPTSGIRRDGYALIVGISDYKNTTAPPYARHDAEVFRGYAEKVLGIPSSNIKLLTDDDATTGLLTAQVQDWLTNKSGWRVVYFAGHGTFDLASPTAGVAYLLPYDGDPELRSTLISVDWLLDKIEPKTGDTTLVILDACFTGGEGRSAQVAARPTVMAEIPKGHRSIVLASSEGHQASFDYEKAGHGRFTYYLLNGLRGNAAGEGGWIYLDDLYDYVRRNVHETSDGKQTPVLKGESERVKVGKVR